MSHVAELSQILAPQGIKTVSTGSDEIAHVLNLAWGTHDVAQLRSLHAERLRAIEGARVLLLGVPMDAGAGFERGSFKGPLGLRSVLYGSGEVARTFAELDVLDIGDVRVNAHLIDDAYLKDDFVSGVRRARGYDGEYPVAPHSILRRALDIIHELNPAARVMVLGGDHSISRVPLEALDRAKGPLRQGFEVVHVDAHTDLLSERDGVPHTFATWAWHANELIGRGFKLQQVGIRASGRTKAYWESTLGVRQHWSSRCAQDGEGVVVEVVGELRRAGVTKVYISNDIDGTDPAFAAATGTMEPDGLLPGLVERLLEALGEAFEVWGADVVEVAPPLKRDRPGEPQKTLEVAARYVVAGVSCARG
ncbi:MAG: arginase family protein [Myxococcota bacterium]